MMVEYVLLLTVLSTPVKEAPAGSFQTKAACERMGNKIVADYRTDAGKAIYGFRCKRIGQ